MACRIVKWAHDNNSSGSIQAALPLESVASSRLTRRKPFARWTQLSVAVTRFEHLVDTLPRSLKVARDRVVGPQCTSFEGGAPQVPEWLFLCPAF